MALRVMVVEDNLLHCKLYEAWLTGAGFQAIIVPDERKAQNVAINEKPDVAVVDVRLPHISGLDIIEGLKVSPLTRKTPVMAVTVLSSRQDEEACLAAGADHFMTKPVSMHLLTKAIMALKHQQT